MELMDNKESQLVNELMTNVPANVIGSIQKVIVFAQDRHTGQQRPGGESQMVHALRVAIAAACYAREQQPDDLVPLVQASLLHDVLEDTETSDEELSAMFGSEVTSVVRAVSHEEEEESDEIYLSRVAAGGQLALLVKRFDRLDNLRSLTNAPASFRQRKAEEVKAALPIWQRIDPEGSAQIEQALNSLL